MIFTADGPPNGKASEPEGRFAKARRGVSKLYHAIGGGVDTAKTVYYFVASAAFIVAGTWSYILFVEHREHLPHANVKQLVDYRVLPEGEKWVRVTAEIANIGKIPLRIGCGFLRVWQVLPMTQSIQQRIRDSATGLEVAGPPLKELPRNMYDRPILIEHGETDSVAWEIIVPAETQTVRVYTFFQEVNRNPTCGKEGGLYTGIGWISNSVHDLR